MMWLKQFCGLMLLVGSLPLAHAAERFQLARQSWLIPERGEVTYYVIKLTTHQIGFMPPPNWRIQLLAGEKKVLLEHPNGSAIISMQLIPTDKDKTPNLERDRLRQQVRERYPQAKWVDEFECHTGIASGIAFDLERPGTTNGVSLYTRLAVIPISGYYLELSITTTQLQFKSLHPSLVNLLNFLRFEPIPAEP
jgi:hypothetical protein